MPVRLLRDGPVTWVVIDREEKGNSLDLGHLLELRERLSEACSGEGVVVALRGAGERFFSTGVDLGSVASVRGVEDAWRLMYEGLGGACRAVMECGKPVIAAVNGHAVGIGFELLYAADLAYAVRHAKLGSPAVRWGMVPPASTTLGPILVGAKQAAYIALTGRLITAEEALRMGFLNGVVDSVDELVETVKRVAADIAEAEPWALAQALRLLRSARLEALIDRGLKTLALSTARPVTAERARGFLEGKRKAG